MNPELEQATKMRFWWDESGGVTNFTSLTVQVNEKKYIWKIASI